MGRKLKLRQIGYGALFFLTFYVFARLLTLYLPWLRVVSAVSLAICLSLIIIGLFWSIAVMDRRQRHAILMKKEDERKRHREKLARLSVEQRRFELQNYLSSLRVANKMATWSYIGLLIPVLGWLLARSGYSSLKPIPQGLSESLDRRMQGVRSNLRLSVMLSIVVAMIYLGGYGSYHTASQATQAAGRHQTTTGQVPETMTSQTPPTSQPVLDGSSIESATNANTLSPSSSTTAPSSGLINCSGSNFGSTGTTNCYSSGGSANCYTSNYGSTGSANCYGSDGSSANCYSSNFGSSGTTNCYGSNGSSSCYSNHIGSTSYSNCYGSNGSSSCSTNTIGRETYTNCY